MPFTQTSDNIRLHYEVVGRRSGAPVLMIQGLGADKNAWNLQRVAMATRFRMIAFDNRGVGRSDKPSGPYNLEQMADDAVAVLDAAELSDAHVVGASMGGVIGQIIAVKYPDRVRSLTLACTASRNHPWRHELLQNWADTAQFRGMSALGRQTAQWVIGPRSLRRIMPTIGWLGPLAAMRPSAPFVSQVQALLSHDESLHAAISTIKAPTLVIVGNQDILTPRGDSEEIADKISNSELVVISGAAHGLMFEHAGTFNRVLIDFLQRVERSVNN